MTRAVARDPIYRRRRFSTETIELCVRWYITYRLSYRDLVAMMAERGIVVSHTTIMRLGAAVRPGVRAAMGAILAAGGSLVANGRDRRFRAGRPALPVPGSRSPRKVR
jgi:acetyltransferase-like isoleucine patch superfamily enzyme